MGITLNTSMRRYFDRFVFISCYIEWTILSSYFPFLEWIMTNIYKKDEEEVISDNNFIEVLYMKGQNSHRFINRIYQLDAKCVALKEKWDIELPY